MSNGLQGVLSSQLSANNEEGSSKWSDAVSYRTLPDKPCAPPKPQIKGKVHSNSFRVSWGESRCFVKVEMWSPRHEMPAS